MKRIVFLVATVCSLLMTSCSKRIYWEDMQPNYLYSISRSVEMKIQPGDRLRILVNSKNPELVTPFNWGVVGYQVDMDGTVKSTGADIEVGYRVDNEGNIDFPLLGMLHVEGMTLLELSSRIKEELRQRRLVSDAMITVNLLNLKIYVLGQVSSEGIITTQDDRITLLEAITKAGGLSNNAAMDRILVIREDANGRRKMINDIRTVNMFNSPSFYLQPNDIVYVEPKIAPVTAVEQRTMQLFTMFLTTTGTILSLLILTNVYKR